MNPNGLVNIVTGRVIVHPFVNVNNAPSIGKEQMQAFKKTWPSEFHKTIHKSVHTMAISQKHIKVSDTKVIDVEMIYARAKGLQSSG